MLTDQLARSIVPSLNRRTTQNIPSSRKRLETWEDVV